MYINKKEYKLMDELFKEMTEDFSFLKEVNYSSWCKKCKSERKM